MQQLEEARAPLLLYVQYEYLPVRHGAAILDSFSRVHEAVLIALRKDLDKFGCYGVPFRWGMSPSHTLNSSLAQSIAMICGCDWEVASRAAGILSMLRGGSLSHGGAAESTYCIVVSAGQASSV
jgi:hypothetical protein